MKLTKEELDNLIAEAVAKVAPPAMDEATIGTMVDAQLKEALKVQEEERKNVVSTETEPAENPWKCFAEFAKAVQVAAVTHERRLDKRLLDYAVKPEEKAAMKATDLSEGDSEYGGYGINALVKSDQMLGTLLGPEVLIMQKSEGLGNQAGKITDICWLAGIIDGDGCIGVHKQKSGKKTTYVPSFGLSTTCQKTYLFLDNLFNQLEIGHHWIYRTVQNKNWRDRWCLQVRGMKRVDKLLGMVYPYLVTKREEAELIKNFIQLRILRGKKGAYSQEEIEIIERTKEIKRERNGNLSVKSPETIRQTQSRL